MSIAYNYVDLKTFKMLHVDEGRMAWHHWGLMDHEGIIIRLEYLGFPVEKSCYLPYSLLKKLYTAFDDMGGYQGTLITGGLLEVLISQKYTDDESDYLHDERKGCFTLNTYEVEEGYIHLTPLLPELLDMSILEKIAKDPALSIQLFEKMRDTVISDRTIWNHKHGRWSQEWIDYCNKLVAENSNLQRFE